MLRRARIIGAIVVAAGACRVVGEPGEVVARSGAAAPSGVPRPAVAPADSTDPHGKDGGWTRRLLAAAPGVSAASRPWSIVDACEPPAHPRPSAVAVVQDVVYATRQGHPLRLDIAWPRDGAHHPLVLLVHGGAWVGGDRLYHRDDMLKLARAGYVAATIDYRLVGSRGVAFPAPLHDLRCAVRFVRSRAEEFHVDPEHVGAIGDSAGGHLVAMLATADDVPDDPAEDGGCSTAISGRIQAAVLDYAPLDLRAWRSYPPSIEQAIRMLLGVDPAADPVRAAWASPISHLDPGDPPMLILHASRDRVVPVESARSFASAARVAGVRSLYVELESVGLGHGFLVLGSGEVLQRSTCTTMAFLASTLR